MGLFPATKSENSGNIVRKRFEKSKMKIEGFKYNHGLRYIRMNQELTTEIEEIDYLLPSRRTNNGRTPVMSGSSIRAKDDDPETQWSFPKQEDALTEWERRQIVARTAEIGVRAIFEHFTYRWGGEVYRQSSGGPIGSRLTMAVSRVLMGRWSHQVRKIMQESNIPPCQYMLMTLGWS